MRTVSFLVRSLEAGGAERQLVLLASELKKRGCLVYINLFYGKGEFIDEARQAGVIVNNLDKRGRWDILRLTRRIYRDIKSQNPDVIYSFMVTANIFASLLKILGLRVPLVWGVRQSKLNEDKVSKLALLIDNVSKYFSYFADRVIFNSCAGRDYFINNGYLNTTAEVVHNGIDTNLFSRRTNQNNRKIVIGVVSRIDPLKNLEHFLLAASKLTQLYSCLEFRVAGDGDKVYLDTLKRLESRLDIKPPIIWSGHISNIEDVYAQLDIFVSCSVSEGFSNSVAEAMASGAFCVVTDAGDSATIVGDAGLVIKPDNIDELVSALITAINMDSKKRRLIGKHGRNRIITNYSVDNLINETINVFNKVCKE